MKSNKGDIGFYHLKTRLGIRAGTVHSLQKLKVIFVHKEIE